MNVKNLSTENLEELLNNAPDGRKNNKPPKKEYISVINFIKDKGIMPGDNRIPTSIIYYEYRRNYNRYNSYNKVGRVAFFHTFAQHFTSVRSNGKRYYMLNDSIEITEEKMERATNHARRRKGEQKKEG
jgi:hypothetical protein